MGDMAALARLAERYDRMILHESGDAGDTFSVAEDGILYRYSVPVPPQERRQPAPRPSRVHVPAVPLTVLPPLRDLPQQEKRSA